VFKKAALVASTAVGLMLIGSPAFAVGTDAPGSDSDDNHQSAPVGLVNLQDILNEPNIGVCDWSVNVLAVSAQEVLNDFGLSVPLLTAGGETETEGGEGSPDLCAAPMSSDDDGNSSASSRGK
jgi:hypothetical protein